jgi:CheY-like chemotaxis protein
VFWESPSRRILREIAVEVREAARQVVLTCASCERRGLDLLDALEASLARGGSRVLVAHPDQTARDRIAAHLTSLGYRVETVGDGLDAMRRIAANDIGLLVVALDLPGVDGAALASLADRPGFPVLVLAGDRDDPRLTTLQDFAVGDLEVMADPTDLEGIGRFVVERMPFPERRDA